MLTFVLSDGREITWYIGTPVPEIWQAKDKSKPRRVVTEIQADGDERAHIARNFQGIPLNPGHRSTIWRGETACFIYDNLKLNDSSCPRSSEATTAVTGGGNENQ